MCKSPACSPSPSSAQEFPLCRLPPPPMSSPQRPLLQIGSAPTPLTFISSFFIGSRAEVPLFLPPEHRRLTLRERGGPVRRPPPPLLQERGGPAWPPLPPDARLPPLEVDPSEPRAAARGRPAGAASATGPHTAATAALDLGPLAILLKAGGRRQGPIVRHDPTVVSAPMCALAAGSRV
jgi:hypothetical protein